MGSLTGSSFAALWNSAQMAAYRSADAAADWSLSPACTGCTQQLPETRQLSETRRLPGTHR